MNQKRKEERERGWISKRFSRGLRAFGRRYFTFSLSSYSKKRRYDRQLRRSSPALQLVWILILIILLVSMRGENRIYILYVFVPIYFLLLIWEIWIIGAPVDDD